MYPLADDGWDKFRDLGVSLTRRAENTQFFQVIAIDGGTLAYEARTATGRVYDAFRLEKQARGPNRIVELPTDFAAERTFENTGRYENPRLDQIPASPSH